MASNAIKDTGDKIKRPSGKYSALYFLKGQLLFLQNCVLIF